MSFNLIFINVNFIKFYSFLDIFFASFNFFAIINTVLSISY